MKIQLFHVKFHPFFTFLLLISLGMRGGYFFPQNSSLVRDVFVLKLDIKIGYIHESLHRFLSESQEWENESYGRYCYRKKKLRSL